MKPKKTTTLLSQLTMILPVLLLLVSTASADVCPGEPRCTCKWVVGKRTAECKDAGLTSIPNTLEGATQRIVLDGNPLEKLDSNAFQQAGLVNLQEVSLKSCHILQVHENAFRGLPILREVDLSFNNMTKLKPKTFEGNDNLQIIKLVKNPLQALVPFQFPPLTNLKKLDFSNCQLNTIDRKAFQNLGHGIETILLNNNNLRTVSVESFVPLQSTLKTLHLHENPWDCDCKLQSFREFVVSKKLYNRPTACAEPARLHGKMWDDINKREFACKPHIEIPYEFVFGSPGVNATLSCHVTGSPPPTTRWVVKGRIVNNNTSPIPFNDQKWILYEETYGIQKWYNLTVTNAGYDNLGQYVCVAENTGGVMEKTVTLTFEDPDTYHAGLGLSSDQWTMIIASVMAILVFIALIIAFVCCCRFCKQGNKEVNKHNHHRKNGTQISAYDHADQSQQRLLPPTPMAEIVQTPVNGTYRAPSVISKNQSCATTTDSHSSHSNIENYDPDLIHHHYNMKKTSTPLSVQTLNSHHMQHHHHHHQGSSVLNGSHHRVSPFTRSGTLPIHYHYNNPSRSISCDHHGSSQTLRLTPQPPKQKHSLPVHSNNQRPGYVTLPRRPRSSWSAPPRESPTPSIQYAMTLQRPTKREPIYDGVGPRTSADGSSMGTLPRSSNKPCSPVGSGGGHKVSLGPYYAPIAELQECPASPKEECKNKSNNSSSEMTLMEESISSYCEPFGKALAPTAHETTPTPLSSSNSTGGKSRHSTTSAESELEALIIPNGSNRTNGGENGHHKLENDIPPMMPLLPPIMTANHGIAETSFNGNSAEQDNKKVPPKTLPKPKVRPLPPPKPNKSAMLNRPVTFQDEGVDGSEV